MSEENKKPVLINLMAIARYDQMPDYPIQFMTKGMLHYRNPETAVLTYTETQPDDGSGGMIESDIVLNMESHRVTMECRGDYSNTMVFIPGHRYEGVYRTPFGEMGMAVSARSVDCRIGKDKGAVHLKYQLDVQGSYTSTNELHLEYLAEKGENPE